MNQAQQESLQRLRQAAQTIERLVPLELKRCSKQRKHDLESTYATLLLHATKLHLHVPALGTFYQPQQYLNYSQLVLRQLDCLEAIVGAKDIPAVLEQDRSWQVQPEASAEITYGAFEQFYSFTQPEIDGLIAILRHYFPKVPIQNRTVEWAVLKQQDMEAQDLLAKQRVAQYVQDGTAEADSDNPHMHEVRGAGASRATEIDAGQTKRSLLFLNALSAQIRPFPYVEECVQELIAARLALSLCTVQSLWLDVDMTQVRQRYAREKSSPPMLSVAETLRHLFGQTEWMREVPRWQWHAVLVVPALGHVDKLYVLQREATRLTDGHDAAMMVLHQDEHEPGPHLVQVIPDPDHDTVFLDALMQTRGKQGGQP